MSKPLMVQFNVTAVGDFVMHFDGHKEYAEWVGGLGDGDILSQVENQSGFSVTAFSSEVVND